MTRRQKKLIAKMACYRRAGTVLQVPYTPDFNLAKRVRAVVGEDASRPAAVLLSP